MISKTFNRYIWLLNTLLQHRRLTFEEISCRWKDSCLGDGRPLALRTFHMHREAIAETSIGTWNSGRDLSKRLLEDMKEVALGTVNNWCKGVIVWNLMLDNDRAPNREGGCQTCYGAVDISNSDYKTIIRNSHYYIIAHLSSVVKPGAVRIGASGYADSNIMYSAFENPDGTYAFVLMNNNEKTKRITFSDGKRHFAYDVPGKSVTSYRWAKSE